MEVSPPRYIGQSRFVRWWPNLLIAAGLVLGLSGAGSPGVGVSLMLFGAVVSGTMPWRFVVVDEGIALWFGFGRRGFRPRDSIAVRVGLGPAVVFRRGRERFGLPLSDGLVEQRRAELRSVLAEHGFALL